jgi:lysine-specific demethylase/histidyl-hydroxylase NO66
VLKEFEQNFDLLRKLIEPLGVSEFLRDYYEKKPILSPNNKCRNFDDLISLEKLDHLLATSELPPASIDMARSKPPISKANFTFKSGNIDRGAVVRHYQSGATIIFPQINLAIDELANFCRNLEFELSCKVQTNVYLTPRNSQGFKTHYDDHDVFILQIHGKKNWNLYQQAVEKPFRGEPFDSSEHEAGKLNLNFTMEPGDCLYIPRGYMHDATNVGSEPSLHITVGLLVKKWADLMLEVLSEVALNNSEFRESLPVGFAKKDFDMSNARTDFRKLVETFANEADFDNVFNMFKQEYYRTRKPNLKGALMQSSVGIETGTSYRLRENFQFAIKSEGEQTVVSCAGGDLKFSVSAEVGLRFILEGNSFDRDHFSDLPNDEGKEIIEKLIAFGVIELDC